MRAFLLSLCVVSAAMFAAQQTGAQAQSETPAQTTVETPTAASRQSGSYEKTVSNSLPAWERTAKRAEEAIDAGRASTAAFEELRSQLVTWREGFLSAQSTNKDSIDTLQGQIVALGPKPDGVEEAP